MRDLLPQLHHHKDSLGSNCDSQAAQPLPELLAYSRIYTLLYPLGQCSRLVSPPWPAPLAAVRDTARGPPHRVKGAPFHGPGGTVLYAPECRDGDYALFSHDWVQSGKGS